MDLVRGLVAADKKLKEEHIAYILKEAIKVRIEKYHHYYKGYFIRVLRLGERPRLEEAYLRVSLLR